MKKRLWAGTICVLAFVGLTACGSADIPAASTNSPADHSESQSSGPELSTPLLPKESDALETGDIPVEPEDRGPEFHVSLPPESKPPSEEPEESISESEPPPAQLQPEPTDGSAQPEVQERKILIAYFTWMEHTVVGDSSAVDVDATTSASVLAPGHVAQMAAWIQAGTGGDLFSIVTADPYSSDYDECLDRAADEKAANARPALTGTVANMADYDVIFLGYPDWWATCPMAVFTFLDSCDFSGKTVIPFCATEPAALPPASGTSGRLCPMPRCWTRWAFSVQGWTHRWMPPGPPYKAGWTGWNTEYVVSCRPFLNRGEIVCCFPTRI